MTLNFAARLEMRPSLFLKIVGISVEQFRELLPSVRREVKVQEKERKRLTVRGNHPRQRAIGGGKQFSMSVENRVVLTLVYIRMYTSYDFLSLFFGDIGKSTISTNIGMMRKVLEVVLPTPEKVSRRVFSLASIDGSGREKRITSIEDLATVLPELVVLIDGVEQPKRKPKDSVKRKSQYSGKKKRHCLKQIITTTPENLIVEQSGVYDGSEHDITCYRSHLGSDRSCIQDDEYYRITRRYDSGFIGLQEKDVGGQIIITKKSLRNRPLSAEDKKLRAEHSRKRVAIEHTIGRKKKYRIMSDLYRNHDSLYEQYSTIVSGIVNLRRISKIEQSIGVSFF